MATIAEDAGYVARGFAEKRAELGTRSVSLGLKMSIEDLDRRLRKSRSEAPEAIHSFGFAKLL